MMAENSQLIVKGLAANQIAHQVTGSIIPSKAIIQL
jgi:hypothetical protein